MQNFNYHSHTYRCGHADLDMEDEEYIQEYIKMGFKKMAFTDHSPEKNRIDKREHMRMEYDERNEYLASIKKLKEKYKDQIEIQSGYEIEYLPGEEENLRELKKETDKLILGQHFVYDNNKNLVIFGPKTYTAEEDLMTYAEYLQKSMELKIPDIIAHPDIYMFNREKFGEIERKVAEIICKSAEKNKIPLEININKIFQSTYWEGKKINHDSLEKQKEKLEKKGKPTYPCKEFWEVVSNYKIKVLYGIDAHHRGQILVWNEVVELTKEILGEDLINKLDFI